MTFEQLFDTNVRMKQTYNKLLIVAEKLFAEKGFHGVSVREITSKARVHLSAVNYYFGSKENLYLEVFRRRFLERAKCIREDFKNRLKEAQATKETIIRALSEAVLLGPMNDEERIIHYRLLMREITEPTKAFAIVFKQGLKPLVEEVARALKPHFPKLRQETLILAVLSIISQIIYFNFSRISVSALFERDYDKAFKHLLIEHIVCFSLRGLEGLNEEVSY